MISIPLSSEECFSLPTCGLISQRYSRKASKEIANYLSFSSLFPIFNIQYYISFFFYADLIQLFSITHGALASAIPDKEW